MTRARPNQTRGATRVVLDAFNVAPGEDGAALLPFVHGPSHVALCPANDTAVQRRAGEGAKRPTRPSDCNGGLAGANDRRHVLRSARLESSSASAQVASSDSNSARLSRCMTMRTRYQRGGTPSSSSQTTSG